jgi:hypothetical protein
MSDLNQVGDRDNWICWLCDVAVDPDASVNSDLGPSVDSYALAKGKKGNTALERLAHRACNTMRGKHAPVVPWSRELILGDPAPIVECVERLERKGGRELVAQCSTEADAEAASKWLLDRLTRFAPQMRFSTVIKQGGGQYLLQLVSVD